MKAWFFENGEARQEEVNPLDVNGNLTFVERQDGSVDWLAPHEFEREEVA